MCGNPRQHELRFWRTACTISHYKIHGLYAPALQGSRSIHNRTSSRQQVAFDVLKGCGARFIGLRVHNYDGEYSQKQICQTRVRGHSGCR
jgi:hypothetical protein